MLRLTLLLTLALCAAVVFGADSPAADTETSTTASVTSEETHDVATTTNKNPLGIPSELSFPGGFVGHLITGGAVALAVVVVVLIASIFYPFAAIKSLFTGQSDTSNYRVDTYPTPGVLSANGNTYQETYNSPYSQSGAYSPNYQKRSLEYVGPILKMLNAAYDKYGPKPAHYSNSISQTETSRKRK